jgi:hypothetical protein
VSAFSEPAREKLHGRGENDPHPEAHPLTWYWSHDRGDAEPVRSGPVSPNGWASTSHGDVEGVRLADRQAGGEA